MPCYCDSPILETEPRFQCSKCLTAYHQSCVPNSRIVEEVFGDLFYNYLCKSCSSKPDRDEFRRLPMSWLQLAQLSVYHLAEAAHRDDLAHGRPLTIPRYVSLSREILPFVERNWPHFSPKQSLPPPWRDSLATALSVTHEPSVFLRDPATDAFALIDHTPPIPPEPEPTPPPPLPQPAPLPFVIPPAPPGVNPEAFAAKFMALMSQFGGAPAATKPQSARPPAVPPGIVKQEPSSSIARPPMTQQHRPVTAPIKQEPAKVWPVLPPTQSHGPSAHRPPHPPKPTFDPDPLPPTPPLARERTPDPLPPPHVSAQNRLTRLRKLQDRKRQLHLPPCVSLDVLLSPPASDTDPSMPLTDPPPLSIEPTPYPTIPYLCPPLSHADLVRLPFHESLYGRPQVSFAQQSPLTGRNLKPYIWRDRESKSPHMRLLASVRSRCASDFAPGRQFSIDYCHFGPWFVNQANQLLATTFWDGIDVSEYLQYPDYGIVAMYGKLVVGCALATPDGYLAYVAVLPGWQNAGVGQFMVWWIGLALPRDVTLHVSANNPAMIMYQKMGFKPEEFIVGFYDKYYSPESDASKHALFVRLRKGASLK